MKKVVSGVLLMAASSFALADSGPGCGAGAVLFKGQSGLAPHVLAATTNGALSQTVAMTVGTWGCNANSTINVMAAAFIDQNMEQLAADASRGEGEYLSALMTLLKIEDVDKSHFKVVMQERFDTIFPDQNTTSDQTLSQLESVMQSDSTLAKYLG